MSTWVCLTQKQAHRNARAGGWRLAIPFFHLLVILALVPGASACSKRPAAVQPDRSTPGAEPTGAGQPSRPGGAPSGAGIVVTFAAYSFLWDA